MSKYFPLIVFGILALLFMFPLIPNLSYWGEHDWDQHFFYHGVAEVSVKKFGQFPLWNPFYCAGNPYIANPQTPTLSPFFILLLVFGTVIGLKIQILAYMFIGLAGSYLLARELGIRGYSAFIPPIAFMFSSWFALRVVVGHTTFFPFALIPLVVYCYIRALKDRIFFVFASLLMAVMFLSGGVYPVLFLAVFLGLYSIFEVIEQKKIKPFFILVLIAIFFVLISAVKILPMVEFTSSVGFVQKDNEFMSFNLLLKGLFDRNQDIESQNVLIGRSSSMNIQEVFVENVKGTIPYGFHEYAAYIGFIVFLLYLASFIDFKKNYRLILISLFFLWLAMGSAAPINLWDLLRNIPFFSSIHIPSRFIIMFVFCASLLAGKAASELNFFKNDKILVAVIILMVVDLLLVSWPLVGNAFRVEPLEIDTFSFQDYSQIYINESMIINQYPNMLQNLGTWNCYERIHLTQRATPEFLDVYGVNPYFNGNAYFLDDNSSAKLAYFSPNKVVVEFNSNSSKTLILNQNYYLGWNAKGYDLFSYKGLIAVNVTKEDHKVEFYYFPSSFIIGLFISILCIIIAGVLVYLKYVKWQN